MVGRLAAGHLTSPLGMHLADHLPSCVRFTVRRAPGADKRISRAVGVRRATVTPCADGFGVLLTDIRPLQASRDYRRLWVGNTVSQLGQQMTAVTIAIQVYALTGSTFSVGLVGLFALFPLMAFGLYGGSFADAVDRRKLALVVVARAVGAVARAGRAGGRSSCESVGCCTSWWPLQSACFAVNSPTRSGDRPAAHRRRTCCRPRTRSTWRRSTSASPSVRCSGRWRSARRLPVRVRRSTP